MKKLGLLLSLLITSTLLGQNQNIEGAVQSINRPVGNEQVGTPTGITPSGGVSELYPGEAEDFGVQRLTTEKKYRKWMKASLDWQFGYTDNYLFQSSSIVVANAGVQAGKIDTTVMISTLDVALAPDTFDYWSGKMSPKIGYRHQWWNYGQLIDKTSDFNNFDFETQTFYGELPYGFLETWSVFIGADFTRLVTREGTTNDDYNEFYKQVGPKWGINKLFKLNDYNFISLGMDQQYLFTEVDEVSGLSNNLNDRFNHTVTAAYTWTPLDRLYLTPYYRFTATYYPDFEVTNGTAGEHEDRTDYLNSVGAIVAYQFNEYLSARVYISHDWKDTTYFRSGDTTTVQDYEKFDGGLGGTFSIAF
jgi:hypothetical protein